MPRGSGEGRDMLQTRFWASVTWPSGRPGRQFEWRVTDADAQGVDGKLVESGHRESAWAACADAMVALSRAVAAAEGQSNAKEG
jgi:hypothetical protein